MDEERKKVTESEYIVLGSFFFGIGFICLLISLTGVGVIFVSPLQGFATFVNNQFFKAKGSKTTWRPDKNFKKFSAGTIPFSTLIFFLSEAFIHNHPELARVGGKVIGAAVGGPAGAKIGGAVGEVFAGGSVKKAAIDIISPK